MDALNYIPVSLPFSVDWPFYSKRGYHKFFSWFVSSPLQNVYTSTLPLLFPLRFGVRVSTSPKKCYVPGLQFPSVIPSLEITQILLPRNNLLLNSIPFQHHLFFHFSYLKKAISTCSAISSPLRSSTPWSLDFTTLHWNFLLKVANILPFKSEWHFFPTMKVNYCDRLSSNIHSYFFS